MLKFAQLDSLALEAGGVLIGRHLAGTRHVVVDQVTVPMPGDRRSRSAFTRKQRRHQTLIDVEWQRSDGRCVYLGEWHTHPEPTPTPSGVDMNDWARRLRKDVVHADSMFFVIIGQVELCVWEGSRRSFGVARLRSRDLGGP